MKVKMLLMAAAFLLVASPIFAADGGGTNWVAITSGFSMAIASGVCGMAQGKAVAAAAARAVEVSRFPGVSRPYQLIELDDGRFRSARLYGGRARRPENRAPRMSPEPSSPSSGGLARHPLRAPTMSTPTKHPRAPGMAARTTRTATTPTPRHLRS